MDWLPGLASWLAALQGDLFLCKEKPVSLALKAYSLYDVHLMGKFVENCVLLV